MIKNQTGCEPAAALARTLPFCLFVGCAPLNQRLISTDPKVRIAALQEMNAHSDIEKYQLRDDLVNILRHKADPSRTYACEALIDLDNTILAAGNDVTENSLIQCVPFTSRALPVLLSNLPTWPSTTRETGIRDIAGLGISIIPKLREGLHSSEAQRLIAAEILRTMGPEARGAVPDLLSVLDQTLLRCEPYA